MLELLALLPTEPFPIPGHFSSPRINFVSLRSKVSPLLSMYDL